MFQLNIGNESHSFIYNGHCIYNTKILEIFDVELISKATVHQLVHKNVRGNNTHIHTHAHAHTCTYALTHTHTLYEQDDAINA